MAIQVRRGLKADFDPNKLLPGEFAAPLDTKELYLAYGAGDVKRMSTYEDMKDNIEEVTQDIVNTLANDVNIAVDNAKTKATYAQQKGDYAKDQGDYARTKGQEAQSVIDSAAPILNQNLQATYSDKGSVTGKFINFQFADDAMAQVNIKGATTVVPTNPDLPISPDNKATLVSAQNFDLVSCGKNLFNGKLKNGRLNANGSVNGGASNIIYNDNGFTFTTTSPWYGVRTDFIPVKSNEYYTYKYEITSTTAGSSVGSYYLTEYDINKQIIKVTTLGKKQQFTFLTSTTTAYVSIDFQNETVGTTTISNFQLEFGSTATTYTEYKEHRINIPYDMGEWNEIKYGQYVKGAEEYTFTGAESWTKSSTTVPYFTISLPKSKSLGGIVCDKFPKENIANSDTVDKIAIFITTDKTLRIRTGNTLATTLQDFKNWLSSNPITVRYELATPIVTPLNTYLKTFKGTTNIYTTANPQVELTATFKSQLWTDLNNQQKAIESKFDKNRIVNNFLATDPTTALSGAMGKLLNDKITELQNITSIMDARGTNKNASAYRTQRKTLEFNLSTDIGLPVVDTWQCIVETDFPWIDLTGTPIQKAYGYDTSGVYREFVRNCGYNDDWGEWEDNALPSWATGKYVAVDLNNYKKVGIYIYNGWDATLLNKPVINKWGTLIISNTGTTVSQTLITEDAVVYSRKYEPFVGWEPWKSNDLNTIKPMTINSTYGNIVSGGYVKNGRNVTISVRIKITTEMPSHQGHIGGVPNGITDILPLLCVTTGGVSIDGIYLAGTSIARGSNLPIGEYVISGSYISLI